MQPFLEAQGIHEPTDVQAGAIPAILSGDNVAVRCYTGSGAVCAWAAPIHAVSNDLPLHASTDLIMCCPVLHNVPQLPPMLPYPPAGKTLAYLLPALTLAVARAEAEWAAATRKTAGQAGTVQVIVVAPSRELAMQIVRVAQVRAFLVLVSVQEATAPHTCSLVPRRSAVHCVGLCLQAYPYGMAQLAPCLVGKAATHLAACLPLLLQSLLPESARRGVQQAIGGANIWRQRDALKVGLGLGLHLVALALEQQGVAAVRAAVGAQAALASHAFAPCIAGTPCLPAPLLLPQMLKPFMVVGTPGRLAELSRDGSLQTHK